MYVVYVVMYCNIMYQCMYALAVCSLSSTAEGLLEQSLAVFEESYGSDSWECLGVRNKEGGEWHPESSVVVVACSLAHHAFICSHCKAWQFSLCLYLHSVFCC